MNILKMTDEEINDFVDKLWNKKKEEMVEFFKKEIGEIAKQDKKEPKSLSDYRCCKELGRDDTYKYISDLNEINTCIWDNEYEEDEYRLSVGNVYSIGTPDELLERELKKRQLWFALEKHLKEKGCLATDEDWKDKKRYKFIARFDYSKNTFLIDWQKCWKTNVIYSTNGKTLENYMNTLSEEDIKIMFDVE